MSPLVTHLIIWSSLSRDLPCSFQSRILLPNDLYICIRVMILPFSENYCHSFLNWSEGFSYREPMLPALCPTAHGVYSSTPSSLCSTLTPCPRPRHPRGSVTLLWAPPLFLAYRDLPFLLSGLATKLTSIFHVWIGEKGLLPSAQSIFD